MANKPDKKTLEQQFAELRSKTLRQQNQAEKKIRATYKELLSDLQGFLGKEYAQLAQDGKLTYSILKQKGEYARFLEEVTKRLDGITPDVSKEIHKAVNDIYELNYKGLVEAVSKAKDTVELAEDLKSVASATPEVIKSAINNPIEKLVLSDTLEHNRQTIIYNIRKQVGIGLVNGDTYNTMAKRIATSLDGDYKKAIRIARTETHKVREKGLNDAAIECSNAINQGKSGLIMVKVWRTMKDQRVRDSHGPMEGEIALVDEEFELPSGSVTLSPSNSGVASDDINCRCYLSYKLMTAEEYEKATGKEHKATQKVEQKEEHGTHFEDYLTGYNSNELKGLALSQNVMDFGELMKASDEDVSNALVKWFKETDKDIVSFKSKYGHLAKGDNAVDVIDSLHTIGFDDVPVTLNRSSDFQKYAVLTRDIADDLPDLVNSLDDVEGVYTMFRGVQNNMGIKGSTINEMTKQSNYAFYGNGIFGDGIYFTTSNIGSERYGGDIIEAKLKKDAKIIEYDELREKAPSNIADSNLSVWASMNGYDAIVQQVDRAEKGEMYISVLRRSALWIKK